MQDHEQYIKDQLVPLIVKFSKLIDDEIANLNIAAPAVVKHALLVNTLHGAFAVKMQALEVGGLCDLYGMIFDTLSFEKETLFIVAKEFEKRKNDDPFHQSKN